MADRLAVERCQRRCDRRAGRRIAPEHAGISCTHGLDVLNRTRRPSLLPTFSLSLATAPGSATDGGVQSTQSSLPDSSGGVVGGDTQLSSSDDSVQSSAGLVYTGCGASARHSSRSRLLGAGRAARGTAMCRSCTGRAGSSRMPPVGVMLGDGRPFSAASSAAQTSSRSVRPSCGNNQRDTECVSGCWVRGGFKRTRGAARVGRGWGGTAHHSLGCAAAREAGVQRVGLYHQRVGGVAHHHVGAAPGRCQRRDRHRV